MKTTNESLNPLDTQPIGRTFVKYLVPSLVGMLLMALNFVVDGIMVGNRLGPVALAGVGIAGPVYTVFVAMSLWIGIGGATLFSQAMGAKKPERAHFIFTQSLILIFSATLIIGLIAFIFREPLVYALGANEETYPFASAYLNVMLLLGFVFTIENATSVFVRNDRNPNLAMAALIVTAVSNVILNYIILYILNLGVAGAAYGTIISAALGIVVLSLHFFRKNNQLRLVRFKLDRPILLQAIMLGFPSFLAEVGISVFTVSHNVTLERLAGTDGVAAFSVLNYVHGVMLLMFLGMGSAVQPLISYYHGGNQQERKLQTIKIALWTAGIAGFVFFLIGQIAASPIVSIFGNFDETVTSLATSGIRIFFFAYLFMGANFVMMTYYQSIGNVRMATWITFAREILFMLIILFTLPHFIGVTGVWLAIPIAEVLVLTSVFFYVRRHRLNA
ncbi:MATE family efflux transporter [Alkalicoccobacillus murimartini]|uniref:Multidrug export protein MepA n=1 Tax=Alkalicoccobacillus murimartini TaxID=171685 RepID=A0ABT9YKH0_9BACI|nr:MATE family efflux transporter [Alkalicoccobacillus murimartini]MDQ0208369.1 putative MATE family efflux protein [Alkalicoccobacillus murimartini]